MPDLIQSYRAFKIITARRGGTWMASWSCGWFERDAYGFESDRQALEHARQAIDLHYEAEAESHWREFVGAGTVGNGMKG